jgi:hypothetical protein
MLRKIKVNNRFVGRLKFPVVLSTIVFIAILVDGCGAFVWLVPGGTSLVSGEQYVAQLKKGGKLPGIGPQTKGELKSIPQTMKSLSSRTYPQMIDFYFIPAENTNLVFWYEIRREYKKGPWNLIKAAQTCNGGTNTIELLRK